MAKIKQKLIFKSICSIGLAISLSLAVSGCGKKLDHEGARIIHFGNVGEPLSLDPHQASGTWEHQIIADMFTGLVTDDPAGKPIPGIAQSWTISPDGLVWTFKLRDAKWSDGVAVSADDFVFAWQRLFTMKPPAKYASLLFLVKNAQAVYDGKKSVSELGIKALDAKTLIITLEHPAPYLPGLLTHYTTFPIPKHIVEKYGNDWVKPQNIQTNGAFKLEEWAPNDFVHVVKNTNFYDASNVCLNEIYYYPTSDDSSAERRIKTGSLDVQANFSGSRIEQINRTLPGYARISPYIAITYYIFNSRQAPFNDPKVREALSMVIDREFITNDILKSGEQPAYSLVPPGIDGYSSGEVSQNWKSLTREQKLSRARELLAQAGYGPNKPLNFSFSYRNTRESPRVAPIVQQNWREIGPWVNVEIIGSDVQLHYEKLRQGDFQIGDAAWVADFNDARNFLYNYETSAGQMNYGKYSNPQYDSLVHLSDMEKDAKKRSEIMMQAERIVLNDNAMAPVYFYTNRNLVNPRVTGWIDNPNDYHRARYLCTKQALTQQ